MRDREPKSESPRRGAARAARQARAEGRTPVDVARQLARRRSADERRVACELAAVGAADDPREAMSVLEALVADSDRAVRTTATAAVSRVARLQFERVLESLVAWRDADSPPLRRAAALAVARSAESHRLERAPHVARFVRPLLGDAEPAVRRVVTASLVPAFLRAYPETAFETLVESSTSNDPRVLRDVAMAFSSPAAGPLVKRALIVLRKLALDERHAIWRAVAASMWRLGRQRPDVVRPELDRWLDDEARAKPAREALKRL